MVASKIRYVGRARDCGRCTFRTKEVNLPAPIQHMVERALDSFGPDTDVMQRWTGKVDLGNGDSKLEKDFFPHSPDVDICCADGAAFLLYQTGLVPFGRDKGYFNPYHASGQRFGSPGDFHLAQYFAANAHNQDIVYELPAITPDSNHAEVERDSLPGDIFLYYEGPGKDAAHVNVYIGRFIEVVGDEEVEDARHDGIYHMFNSSLGTTGTNRYCTPYSLASNLSIARNMHRSIKRMRVKAIEQLFRNRVSAPLVFAPPKPTPNDPHPPSQAELAWQLAAAGAAPYPVGRALTWHEGIHLVHGAGLQTDAVQAFAAGEIVLARFGEKTRGGDSSFVLARHRFVPDQKQLLGPPPDENHQEDHEQEQDQNAKYLYSLYMQLAPLSTYLDAGNEIEPGVHALYDGRTEPPAGHAVAPAWLRRLWPKPEPAPARLVPPSAPVTLLALTRSGSNGTPELKVIARPDAMTARATSPLADLPSVTVDGDTYWVLPAPGGTTNAGLWNEKIPPARVPGRRNLTYYNPATGETLDTPVRLSGSTILEDQVHGGVASLVRVTGADGTPITGPEGTLVRTRDHASPGVDLTHHHRHPERDDYTYDEQTKSLTFDDDARHIKVYTDTIGEGKHERFSHAHWFDLAKVQGRRTLLVTKWDDHGRRARHPAAWLQLIPGVWMTDDEIAAAEQLLVDQDAALLTAVKARLEAQQSCLVGVDIGAHSGWEMKDGHIAVADDLPDSNRLTIHHKVHGNPKHRRFEAIPRDGDHEHDIAYEIDPPSSDTAIYPLLGPDRYHHGAVFEVLYAVKDDATGTNQADIDAVRHENQRRKPLADKLRAGTLVDLRTEDGVQQSDRNVRHEPIGRMGDVPGPVGERGFVEGVHFELFSGENLVDPSVSGNDGTIVTVPKTHWLVYQDGAAQGLFKPDFVQKLVTLLRAEAQSHHIDLGSLDDAFGQDGVIKPAEWVAFCTQNQRALARLVTVHKPEWKTDWSAEVGSDTRGAHMSQADRDALAADAAQTHWWKDDLSLEGITSDEVFFYHPLRFIEWIRTGIDFVVTAVDQKKPKVKVTPVEGGPEVELVPAADSGAKSTLFRFRTFVGESKAKTEAYFRVTLENVKTAQPTFTVKVVRGEVKTLALTQPSVQHRLETQRQALDEDFHVPVHLGGGAHGYFLADGDRHLRGRYDQLTAMFSVTYNVAMPDTVQIVLDGTEFELREPHVDGATIATIDGAASTPQHWSSPKTLSLAEVASTGAAQEGSRMYTLHIPVTTRTTTLGASGKLQVTFSGGDLIGSHTVDVDLATREMKSRAHGEDVAKLQLYLSQIQADDDLPCYRDIGGSELRDPKKLRTVHVDGGYGPELARSLWRFIYRFYRSTGTVAGITTEPSHEVTQSQIDGVTPSLLESSLPRRIPDDASDADKLYIQRVGRVERRYDHFPVVGQKLLTEITSRFQPPWVLPHIEIFFESTTVPAPPGAVEDTHPDWNKDGRIGKSTVLPLLGDFFQARIVWKDASVERHGDIPIVIEVPEASAYRLLDGARPDGKRLCG